MTQNHELDKTTSNEELYGREYFEFLDEVYDGHNFGNVKSRFSQYLDDLANYSNNRGKLLDIGCSYGYFVKLGQSRGYDAYGMERSKYASEVANEKMGICVSIHDIETGLGFTNDSFDVITLFGVFEHFKRPFDALKEIYRVLKPGGILLMTIPNANSIFRLFSGKKWFGVLDKTHIYFLTPFGIKHLLKKSGFEIIDCTTPFEPLSKSLSKILGRTGLGGIIKVIAGKPTDEG